VDIHELNARLKRGNATEEQLQAITPLYIVLDLDKDIFCRMVDAVGVEVIAAESAKWEWLREAQEEKIARQQYFKDIQRLEDLLEEKEQIDNRVAAYLKKAAL
jgi:hypothetical protein